MNQLMTSLDRPFIVLDGGLSTALEILGCELNTSLWTGELLRSNPQNIKAAHQAYVNSGAQIVITSSYQISYSGCLKFGWSTEDVDNALILSTQLAKETGVKVAASIGTYGASLADGSEFHGNYEVSDELLKEFHYRRLIILASTSPDYLAIETCPDLKEATIILQLIKELNITIPCWISFSCKENGLINSGIPFAHAVDICQSLGATYIGINCTHPQYITELLQSVSRKDISYVVYPNSGKSFNVETRLWEGESNCFVYNDIVDWIQLGAKIIGGCCDVGKTDIAKLSSICSNI